jgi:hypothetical protein
MRTNSSGKAGPPMPFDCAANSINFNTQIGNMRDPRRARNAYVILYYADGTNDIIPMEASGNSYYKITLLNPDNQASGIPINTTPVATSAFIGIAEHGNPATQAKPYKKYALKESNIWGNYKPERYHHNRKYAKAEWLKGKR